ncbi:rhodanese-like domain-containing protein [Micropruina sp.]|uniref:rhodanese-like domain-containing protein n=1 Tax=Micropruina sp. TaxID=2737536 RepID=UPI0039E4C7E1
MNIRQTSVHAFRDDAVLLDVREPVEWAAGHAPNAVHLPLGQLPHRLTDLPAVGGALPVVCRSGVRSAQAVAYLQTRGVDAINVAGGMQAWEEAGKALVCDSGRGLVL